VTPATGARNEEASVFGPKRSADEVVREAVALASLSQKEVAAQYLDVRERIFEAPENRNRPPSSDPVRPADVPPELFAPVAEYYSHDEVHGLQKGPAASQAARDRGRTS
jgi:hypothetical protein